LPVGKSNQKGLGKVAEIGIIGGTGVYDPTMLKDMRRIKMDTPYGSTSDEIAVGKMGSRGVAFINRHGPGHSIPPHMVNSRANIWALKEIGVTRIISSGAVGSLKEEIVPGDIVISDQFIDFTKKRSYTFYDDGKVFHVSMADPFCPEIRLAISRSSKTLGFPAKAKGTYVCIEGPRFSTRAESRMFRTFGDIIGMTLVPEAQLARELEMCYASVNAVTDYDVWSETPVSTEEILRTMEKSEGNVRAIIEDAVSRMPTERTCPCKDALKDAGM
jgi:5'-methylthioadenosine phosphorylase